MRVEGVYLDGIGHHLPDWVSAEDAVADGRYRAEVFEASGLTGTHISTKLPALDMAVLAARTALERSSAGTADVESHIHASVYYQGPEGSYPPGYILRELGVAGAGSLEIRQGCNGLLAALEIAVGQLTGVAELAVALLTTAQNFETPLVDRWHGFGDSYILADGAAAAVVTTEPGFAEVRSICSGTLPGLERWHRGDGPLTPPVEQSAEQVSMTARAAAFTDDEMPLARAVESLSEFDVGIIRRALVDADLNVADLARVITINEDARMTEFTTLGPLGIDVSLSTWDYGRSVGHVGAADLVISLDHLLDTGQVHPGDHLLLVSQGPGWLCSAAVLTLLEKPSWLE
ncbi:MULTISPECIES: ketoacyl-ACP synthase III family protein [unclassified Micromonospora]|uniref:ketoacyl-ACP synthase III family protein n=1 Tax=unclassified Micromonospora TaxID=2617518 RepID=UPI001C5FB0BB|nr:ketoacyl-ACP synthase III family protein [Micromonospora sp. RL09-050-HVF-A]MBW4705756.1 ketoacyl-ACP synthase III family protein [Micromonospora sp. RL09-050-HVF-A]